MTTAAYPLAQSFDLISVAALPDDVGSLERQRARYATLQMARDRGLSEVLAYELSGLANAYGTLT